MKGETVTLVYKGVAGEKDPFGGVSYTDVSQDIENVLVSPGVAADDIDSNRPDGVIVKYTLYFPKLFVYGIDPEIFRGATITIRGKNYNVIGVPGYYDAENCPTEWCMPVYVEDIDG